MRQCLQCPEYRHARLRRRRHAAETGRTSDPSILLRMLPTPIWIAGQSNWKTEYVCVVLQLWNRTGRGCDNSNESGFRSKHTNNEAMEQTDLRTHRTPARLAFADHMHRLVTGDRAPSSPKRVEMLTHVDPTLDRHGDAVPGTAPVDHIQPTLRFDPNETSPLKDFTFLLQCDCFETSYAQKSTC
jgi:hypothetical protein